MDTINFTNNNENVNKQVSLFWNEEREELFFNSGISAMTPQILTRFQTSKCNFPLQFLD